MQGHEVDDSLLDGWLLEHAELFDARSPGRTCISALLRRRARAGDCNSSINSSKGCGGVMRVAPAAFFTDRPMVLACRLAAITHSHPSGYLAAGCLARIVRALFDGSPLDEALQSTYRAICDDYGGEEVAAALHEAMELAHAITHPGPEHIERLGEGWVAEEALSISAFCALKAHSFEEGVLLAVNHSGDSDSTGAITGNILGCMMGAGSIPAAWLERLELRDAIERMCSKMTGLGTDLPATP